MDPATKDSLLWGLVGFFAFLALIQGYELLADVPVALAAKFGVALTVGVGAGAATHWARGWLLRNETP